MSEPELLFGKFEVIDCLKKDSFSSVYKAFDNTLHKNVLLKVLDTSNLPDASILERFKREGRILSRLDHPGIIKLLEFKPVNSHFYISFEFFESHNLRDFLKRKSPTFEQKKILLAQLLTALAFAHNNNIIHRDLKPENILVNDLYELKIADFGLARITNENTLTNQTSIVGTPAYMSPEQIKGEQLTVRSDLFSLGILAYELITGKNPFYGADVGSTINNILTLETGELFQDTRIGDEAISAALYKLLQVEPEDRPPSAEACLHYLGIDETAPSQAQTIDKKKRNRKKIIITIIVTFTLLALTSVYFAKVNPGSGNTSEALSLKNNVEIPGFQRMMVSDSLEIRGGEAEVITEEPNGETELAPDTLAAAENSSDTLTNTTETPDTVTSTAAGKLFVEVQPWATIFINSRRYDTTPLKEAISLKPGRYTITLVHPDYPPANRPVTIEAGESAYIRINFALLIGYLECSVYPWGTVYVDGEKKGTTPLREPIPLAPGTHLITIANPDFGEINRSILIEEKQTFHLKHNFTNEE